MGKGYRHGSEELSYGLQIVGGTTMPKNPTQGMVWANTPHEITSVYLAGEKPVNLVAGGLWVRIGRSGSNKIVSPVSKEWITVYPLFAEQYISGEWVNIETLSYHGGAWVKWWSGELYDNGDEFEDITGGWVASKWRVDISGLTANTPTVTRNADNIAISLKGSGVSGTIHTANKIDLTPYKKLTINCGINIAEGAVFVSVSSGASSDVIQNVASHSVWDSTADSLTCDISNINGEYYICASVIAYNGNTKELKIYKCYVK